MSTGQTPFKKRISPWMNPWVLGIGFGLQLVGLPVVLWLMSYHSDAAVAMFVITWLSMTVFVLIMAKTSLHDARYYVDDKAIDRTRKEIQTHRQLAKKEFLKNEIDVLNRGLKTPVLDVWKLNHTLAQRHPYFPATEAIVIDPGSRELQMRIQAGEFEKSAKAIERLRKTLFKDIAVFLRIVSQDAYAEMLRPYFTSVVLEIDSLREDDRHVDVAYPILSLVTEANIVWSLSTSPVVDPSQWMNTLDVRFDDGREVEVHRVIELPGTNK